MFYDNIKMYQEYEEYNAVARLSLENVQLIDDDCRITNYIIRS